MTWIGANNPNNAIALDDLAIATNFSHRRQHFHDSNSLFTHSFQETKQKASSD
jgi:hypothetical protein